MQLQKTLSFVLPATYFKAGANCEWFCTVGHHLPFVLHNVATLKAAVCTIFRHLVETTQIVYKTHKHVLISI